MGSKKVYHTQTQALNNPWDISNSLKGCISNYLYNTGSYLPRIFQDTAQNSLVGKLNNIAKDCQVGGRYASVLGTPEGSLITRPLTKALFEQATNIEIGSLESSRIMQPCEALFKCLALRTLEDNYQFDGEHLTIDEIEYDYVSTYLDETDYIYVRYKKDRVVGGGPSAQIISDYHELNTGIQFTGDLNASYLLVGYKNQEDKLEYYIWNTASQNDVFRNWFDSNRVTYYPSFLMRRDKDSIKRNDPNYFNLCCKIFQRFNMDYEDLVDSFNGEAELNNPTEKDKQYKDSLGNVTDIALTFALDITANDQRVMRYMYEFFKYMYDSSGLNANNIYYRHKAFNYDISWGSITHQIKDGHIAPFHRFTTESFEQTVVHKKSVGQSTINVTSRESCLRIRKQLDNGKYEEILVTNLKFTSYNNGHGMNRTVPTFSNTRGLTPKEIERLKHKDPEEGEENDNSDPNECLLPVLPFILNNKIGGIIGNDIIAISMRSVHNTYKKIKKKWYQSSWFTVVRIVIYIIYIVVVTIGTSGAGTAPAIKSVLSIEALIQLLLVLAIKIAFKIICKVCHIQGATKAILDTLIDIYCIYYLPSQLATTTTTTGAVVQVGSTAVTTTTTVTTSLSTLTSSMITSLATTLVNGNFSLEALASALGSVAVAQTMTVSPTMGFLLDTSTNPQFYYALQTKDWSAALTSVASSMLKAMLAKPAEQVSKSVELTSTDALKKLASPDNISKAFQSEMNAQANKQKTRLEKLNNQMLTLGRLIETSEYKASVALSNNNAIALGVITDSLTRDTNYNFYKIAGQIKKPRIIDI